MKKLKIIYNNRDKTWELFHQDLDEKIAYDDNIYDLIITADIIAKLIRPSKVVFIPHSLLKEILINEYID